MQINLSKINFRGLVSKMQLELIQLQATMFHFQTNYQVLNA